MGVRPSSIRPTAEFDAPNVSAEQKLCVFFLRRIVEMIFHVYLG
jgi:hypothetical protein